MFELGSCVWSRLFINNACFIYLFHLCFFILDNLYIDEFILFDYEHVQSTSIFCEYLLFICKLFNYWISFFIYMMKYESRNGIVWSFSLWLYALIISFLLCLVLYDERFDLLNKNKEIQQIPVCLLIKSFLH